MHECVLIVTSCQAITRSISNSWLPFLHTSTLLYIPLTALTMSHSHADLLQALYLYGLLSSSASRIKKSGNEDFAVAIKWLCRSFLFPVYPAMCFAAALSLHALINMITSPTNKVRNCTRQHVTHVDSFELGWQVHLNYQRLLRSVCCLSHVFPPSTADTTPLLVSMLRYPHWQRMHTPQAPSRYAWEKSGIVFRARSFSPQSKSD